MKPKFKVSENMIMWAFRYALGRRTGAVTDVVIFLIANWNKLEPFTQKQIQKEIREAIDMDLAGNHIDVVQWKSLLTKTTDL